MDLKYFISLLKFVIQIITKYFFSNDLLAVASIVKELQTQLLLQKDHPLHIYTNAKIALQSTLTQRMSRLSPAEFEQVLHPVFQV